MTDVDALLTGLLELGLVITKSAKANAGAVGMVDAVLADPLVISTLSQVIQNAAALPSEVKALNAASFISMIQPVLTGAEAIYAAAKA